MDGSRRLAQVFVELADTLVDQFDTVDFLQTLTDRCVELLDVDASGLLLADQRGALQLVASTMPRARLLELFELQIEEGPCLECFSTGRPMTNVDLAEMRERWPRFASAAVEAGFGGTHAVPMRLRGQVIGALNLFTERRAPLDEEVIAVGQAMADIATIGLLHERNLTDQTVLTDQLQTALNSRVLVEQAKGVLAARADLSVAEAFNRMRNYARRNGLPLSAVASAVVNRSLDAEVLVIS